MMAYSLLLLLILVASYIESAPSVCEIQKKNAAISVLEYVKEQDDGFHLGPEKDFVLVLGITGNGKSTLASLLSGAELESVEIEGSEGDFRIEDKNDKISGVCGTTSKTITPNLMVDESNGIVFYDCPGFSDSRGVKVDMAATFATRKLMNHAESTKFVFTVAYSSVQVAIGDRLDFLELVRFATGLIKDMEKYRDGIALVVTKVPNKYVKKKGQPKLIDDASNIESFANFLRQTRLDLQNKTLEASTEDERQIIAKKMLFIDILLEKKENEYFKIGMMRLADEGGPLSEIPVIQSEKEAMLKMISENLRYIPKGDNDFGYIISDKSKVHLNEITEELKTKLITDFAIISSDIRKYFLQKEKQSSRSLRRSIDTAAMLDQKLSQIISSQPQDFLKQFTDVVDDLGVSFPTNEFNKFCKYIEFLDFVQVFSTSNLTIPTEILNQVLNQRLYLKNSQSWYNFLKTLREKLSTYDVQQRSNDFDGSKLMSLSINIENAERSVADLEIKSLIDLVDPNIYATIEHLYVNTFKLKLLQGIWSQSMLKVSEDCSEDPKRLTVKGYNVLMSDVIESKCWPNATYVEMFALNKLFLDADIDREAMYLSIIAPVWEIVLNKVSPSRQIKLNGGNASNYDSSAQNASVLPDAGAHGLPGISGGPGGQFFGFGQFVNDKNLQVQLVGGKGGNGQDGGNGKIFSFDSFALYGIVIESFNIFYC